MENTLAEILESYCPKDALAQSDGEEGYKSRGKHLPLLFCFEANADLKKKSLFENVELSVLKVNTKTWKPDEGQFYSSLHMP